MGVSGAGKSTVADVLSRKLGWPSAEGDSFHPASNVARMAKGIALTDRDRWPWLEAIAAWIGLQESKGSDCIVTCSALRRAYRDVLRHNHRSVCFVHLVAPSDVIARRLAHRIGHFMPSSLLPSQLELLESLGPSEPGFTVTSAELPEDTADRICIVLREQGRLPDAHRPGAPEPRPSSP
jgi:gluconokinase